MKKENIKRKNGREKRGFVVVVVNLVIVALNQVEFCRSTVDWGFDVAWLHEVEQYSRQWLDSVGDVGLFGCQRR
jgi:hypothetical protein